MQGMHALCLPPTLLPLPAPVNHQQPVITNKQKVCKAMGSQVMLPIPSSGKQQLGFLISL